MAVKAFCCIGVVVMCVLCVHQQTMAAAAIRKVVPSSLDEMDLENIDQLDRDSQAIVDSLRVRRGSRHAQHTDDDEDDWLPEAHEDRAAFPLPDTTHTVPEGNECFFEIRVPKRVRGRCRQAKNGGPYCEVGAYRYRNHPDCYP